MIFKQLGMQSFNFFFFLIFWLTAVEAYIIDAIV